MLWWSFLSAFKSETLWLCNIRARKQGPKARWAYTVWTFVSLRLQSWIQRCFYPRWPSCRLYIVRCWMNYSNIEKGDFARRLHCWKPPAERKFFRISLQLASTWGCSQKTSALIGSNVVITYEDTLLLLKTFFTFSPL